MEERIKWHPAFYGGIELELREYRDYLEFEAEHELAKEPLKMDMLIIKKLLDVMIDNPIAHIFRQYNVIEYKSPRDSLSLRELYKTVGYACLYIGLSMSAKDIPVEGVTVSIFRHTKPIKLFREIERIGASVTKYADGVYHVIGIVNLPLQIVIIGELNQGEHSPLRILTHGALESDIRAFLNEARGLTSLGDKDNADAVLQVSVTANTELFKRIRRDTEMCEALKELMKDELDSAEARGEARGEIKGKLNALADLVRKGVLSIEDAAVGADMTATEFKKFMEDDI